MVADRTPPVASHRADTASIGNSTLKDMEGQWFVAGIRGPCTEGEEATMMDASETPRRQSISDLIVEPSVPQPSVTFAVVSENAFVDKTESVSIIRVIDTFWVDERDPPFALAFHIAVGMRDIPGSTPNVIQLAIYRESDGIVVLTAESDIDGDLETANILTGIPAFPVEQFGKYRLVIIWEGKQLSSTPFEVKRGRAQLPL